MSRPLPAYRKPKEYLPPYNYCDRWCERCRIDKTRCAVYQSVTDAELEAVSQGRDVSGMDFTMEMVRESFRDTLAMIEETAREQGIDFEALTREARERKAEDAETGEGKNPLLERAMSFATDLLHFMRTNEDGLKAAEEAHGESFDALRWYHVMPGPKIARIVGDRPERDPEIAEYVEASDILSAQVAHKALVATEDGLLRVIKVLPTLTDEVIGFLARGKALREALEEDWLSRENALLEPVGDGPWWGPLEDAAKVVEGLRGVRRKRKTRKTGGGTKAP